MFSKKAEKPCATLNPQPSTLRRYLVFKKYSSNFCNSRGYSVVGILVASVIGSIMIMGVGKMISNIGDGVTEFRKESNRMGLVSQMDEMFSRLSCEPIFSMSIDVNDLKSGVSPIEFSTLRNGNGVRILNIKREKEKRMYDLEGHSAFKLSCQEGSGCDCSSSPTCSKSWVLSLFTMSYKNNLPMYKEVLNKEFVINYDSGSFTCDFGGGAPPPAPPLPPLTPALPIGCARGGGTWDRGACVCTGGRTWDGSACVCPGRKTWNGSACVCPERSRWDGSSCACVGDPQWDAERGECNCRFGLSTIQSIPVPDTRFGFVCSPLVSSREYKKNIVLFQGYTEILESILRTPLFTYEYKEDYPEKERLGVIAEELPESLKLPGEPGDPVKPDWVSIQGYLWAGIKALHKELLDLKGFVSVSLELLESSIKKDIKSTEESLREELESLKSDQEILKKRFEELEKEKALLKTEIEQYKQKEINSKNK